MPLLSEKDQQVRLSTYWLWPDIRVSSLGPNWREQVRGWSDEARADFVSELLHHRIDDEVVALAMQDNSIAVKKAAVSGLMWTGSDDALIRVLESMDVQTFEDVVRKNADQMPTALRSKTVAAMCKFIETSTDHPARLRTALNLVEFGETGLDGVIKDAMEALPGGDMRNLGPHYISTGAQVSTQYRSCVGEQVGGDPDFRRCPLRARVLVAVRDRHFRRPRREILRVARSNVEPLRIADDNLKACLRAYLKGSVDLVLRQDDFNGEEKANHVLIARTCWLRGSRNWPSVGRRWPRGCCNCANATYRNLIDTSFRESWAGSERPKPLLQI